jgi:serine/threonine-protein kinase
MPLPLPHDVARRYELDAAFVSDGLPRPPLCSFGHGAAGVAYFLLRYALLAGDPRSLRSARAWSDVAEQTLGRPGAFTGDAPAFPDDRAAIPGSLFFGEAGVWCGATLVASAQDDRPAVDRGTGRYVTVAEGRPADRLDAVSGAAGLLLGAARMLEGLGDAPAERLTGIGESLTEWLTRVAARAGQTSGASGWLGAAHGWCGIAHALLRWSQATATSPGPEVKALLESLEEARLPSGLWPRHTGSPEVWSGWCHGSAGWVQLWTLAWEVLGDGEALALAERAAVDAVAIDDAGPGLCCGEAGSAYAALAMYRATGDGTWLTHAHRLAAQATRTAGDPDVPRHSLWQGDVGVALLLAELEDPSSAAMPLYRRS